MNPAGGHRQDLPLGAWARSGGLIGLIAAVDADSVALFDPAERHLARVAPGDVELLPSAGVSVSATVDVPLPHGLGEDAIRRWLAVLTDETLRERAREALHGQGLDDAAVLPSVRVDVRPLASGAV